MFDRLQHLPPVSPAHGDTLSYLRLAEAEIAAIRAHQVKAIKTMDLAGGGPPSLSVLAAELDVSVTTAGALLETAIRTPIESASMKRLESGEWSFDRAAAMATLTTAGADDATVSDAEERDIAGVHKIRALLNRITRRSEREAHEQRQLRSWASLDESVGFIHGQFAGYDWRVLTKAIDERTDMLRRAGAEATIDQLRADAMVAMAQDWFDGRPGPLRPERAGPIVTVMVDAALASRTNAEAGVVITDGPRIGPDTLDRIMCEGSVEIIVDRGNAVPLAVGPTTRVVPPKMRRFILSRDGACTIGGCNSTYRLEVHHIIPRSRGGTHVPENLTTLCWWHHHVAIHGQGLYIDPESPPKRRRLIPPDSRSP